jgi:hypothetical protein
MFEGAAASRPFSGFPFKTGIPNAYADNLKVQQGFKYFTNQPRDQASHSKISK